MRQYILKLISLTTGLIIVLYGLTYMFYLSDKHEIAAKNDNKITITYESNLGFSKDLILMHNIIIDYYIKTDKNKSDSIQIKETNYKFDYMLKENSFMKYLTCNQIINDESKYLTNVISLLRANSPNNITIKNIYFSDSGTLSEYRKNKFNSN